MCYLTPHQLNITSYYMRKLLSAVFIWVVLLSCNSSQLEKIEIKDKGDLYSVPGDDYGMNKAIDTAKKSLFLFDMAFKSYQYDTGTFALKVKFPTSTGTEHIWATEISIRNGNYYGIIDNIPELTTEVRAGEKLKLDIENITDWMYSDKGILRGGYTIRFIRNQMTREEKNKFDADFQLKVEE